MKIQYANRALSTLLAGQKGDCTLMSTETLGAEPILLAAPGKGGGKPSGEKTPGEAESKKPGPPDRDRQENDARSITDPESPLTGDTGNMELGQTDLGASGTGAEDPTANPSGERE